MQFNVIPRTLLQHVTQVTELVSSIYIREDVEESIYSPLHPAGCRGEYILSSTYRRM